jgi:hypothetical protein
MEGLEELWAIYEPFADSNFRGEFAKQPDTRFWEMYLATRLLAGRRKLIPRAELRTAQRDKGPDVCITKSRRKIWVEAIAPSPGDDKNLDRVPDLFLGGDDVQDMPRRQIELRITGALSTKLKAFQKYKEEGIVGENDSCIVAVSASQFALEAAGEGLPHAVRAVYPFGEEFVELNRRTFDVVRIRQQRRTGPLRRLCRSFARNPAKTIEQQDILPVFVEGDNFLEAIDDLSSQYAALIEAVEVKGDEMLIEAEFFGGI